MVFLFYIQIICAKCKLREALPDNDIILCDGTCNRAFHQKCLDPPLSTENSELSYTLLLPVDHINGFWVLTFAVYSICRIICELHVIKLMIFPVPPGDEGWFCKFCKKKMEILEAINAHLGTHFPLDSNWQVIYPADIFTIPVHFLIQAS